MREIVMTADGSHTVSVPEQKATYHSTHGAIAESMHVFLEAGLNHVRIVEQPITIRIFEMGFGTGLNAFLTAIKSIEQPIPIHYTTVETAPLSTNEVSLLNYSDTLGHAGLFQQLHEAKWNETIRLNDFFTIEKQNTDLLSFSSDSLTVFDLVYYDAFAPSAQPALWTEDVFKKLQGMMQPGGILVTYCSKGDVRRAMIAAGFNVAKLPGPKGKREMVRATVPLLQPNKPNH